MGAAFDTIVVGAGPSGAATAALLARGGQRVLLCDRAAFPRDKACGGGITPRGAVALARIGVDTSSTTFAPVAGIEMAANGRTSAVAFPGTSRFPSHGLVTRRSDLDMAILDLAAGAGCELRLGVRVLGPIMEDGVCRGVRVLHAGRRAEVHADQVIGADGAISRVARGAGLAADASSGRGFWYAAMRGYFGPVAPRRIADGPVLEFYPLRSADGRWLPAYGWVFPLPDGGANVGVDLPHRPAHAWTPALRVAYTAFVDGLRRDRPGFAGADEEAPPVGALLPEAMAGICPGASGLLLVGDAAGLITPYSGEGIVYAIESAELAAAAILGADRPSGVLPAYRRALWDGYGFQFRTGLTFMKGMRRPPLARAAAAAVIGRPRLLRAAVRIMAHLIEDDPGAAPSTVSKGYLAARRVLRPRPESLWLH